MTSTAYQFLTMWSIGTARWTNLEIVRFWGGFKNRWAISFKNERTPPFLNSLRPLQIWQFSILRVSGRLAVGHSTSCPGIQLPTSRISPRHVKLTKPLRVLNVMWFGFAAFSPRQSRWFRVWFTCKTGQTAADFKGWCDLLLEISKPLQFLRGWFPAEQYIKKIIIFYILFSWKPTP
jgi:hypothetical protein